MRTLAGMMRESIVGSLITDVNSNAINGRSEAKPSNEGTTKPLCIDLFCGLGGWAEGFLAEGYDVIGFDIERHDYGTGGYPGQLVLQDVQTLHGSQFKDAAVIVASPPCQKYSYMAMPWSRAKRMAAEYRSGVRSIEALNALFNTSFRIAGEAGVPLIVENVRGAQEWVGPAKWNHGSFYLWGDLPALMPITGARKLPGNGIGAPRWADREVQRLGDALKVPRLDFSKYGTPGYKAQAFNTTAEQRWREGIKNIPHRPTGHWTNPAENGLKVPGINLSEVGFNVAVARQIDPATKPEGFERTEEMKRQHLGFTRKAASAHIAKIPFPLARHIARCFKPHVLDEVCSS